MASKEFIRIEQYLSNVQVQRLDERVEDDTTPLYFFKHDEPKYVVSADNIPCSKSGNCFAFSDLQALEHIYVLDTSFGSLMAKEMLQDFTEVTKNIKLELDSVITAVLASFVDRELKLSALHKIAQVIAESERNLDNGLPKIRFPKAWLSLIDEDYKEIYNLSEVTVSDQDEIELSISHLRIRSSVQVHIDEIAEMCKETKLI
jgi:hypothetical protein